MLKQSMKNLFWDMFLKILKIIRVLKVATGRLKFENGQYGLFSYKGFLFTTEFHSTSRLEALENFSGLEADDIVMLTYPKAGTHFVTSVVSWIFYVKGLTNKVPDRMLSCIPLEANLPGFFGSSGDELSFLKKFKSPRFIGTHLPWRFLPPQVKNHEVKIIHCLRNPKDVACSAYHFCKRVDFAGDFFEFLRDWYPHRDKPNSLYVYYEDMVQDLDKAVRDIAKFIEMDLTEKQVQEVVEKNTFKNIKKEMGNSVMYRKGVSGGWKNEFTVAQNEMVNKWIEEGMTGMDGLKFQYD